MTHALPRTAVALALVGALAAPAAAQTYQVQTGVDSQYFRLGSGQRDLLGLRSSEIAPHLGGHAGATFTLSRAPIRLKVVATGETIELVDLKTGVDVVGSVGLFDWVELGLAVPATLWQTSPQAAIYVLDTGEKSAEGAGMGDLRVTPKVRLLGGAFPFRIAVALELGFPTGDHERFMGHDGFNIAPSLLFGGTAPFGLDVEANLGARWRPDRAVMNVVVGSAMTWGVGVRMPFELSADMAVSVTGTFQGEVALSGPIDSGFGAEAIVAGGFQPMKGLNVTAGAGAGLGIGLGPPQWRVLLGVDYAWPGVDEEEATEPCELGPEDLDGYEDDDGCRDPDNDGDGIEDTEDVCPFEAENYNRHRDGDGCPDTPPAARAPWTDSGTSVWPPARPDPTSDVDGDGVPDVDDVCPGRQEDRDDFEDADGCPDDDNDRDGIRDRSDKCPLQAEVVNGVDDDDGCPDEGESKVEVTREEIRILERIYFASAKDTIRPRSFPLLDQVMAVLRAHRQITLVVIEGHTDSQADAAYNLELSRRRAGAVRDYLIAKGIDATRLESRGYGEDRPIADNETPEGRELNRRVEFHVVEIDGQPVAPPAPAAPSGETEAAE